MKVCGVIVEYNPFHNGHLYHVEKAREITNADCIIAVMSGPFLQRGEPAIIDKYHRTKAALLGGVDMVLELPYVYAVQSSELFARGAVLTLNALGVDYICFGSESGEIESFIQSAKTIDKNKAAFNRAIKQYLNDGLSYPVASQHAYEKIGLDRLDLFKPNNILGFSYVQTIIKEKLAIEAVTITRKQSHYHDEGLTTPIASATSIRKKILDNHQYDAISETLPAVSLKQFKDYENFTKHLHQWKAYFPLLRFKVMTMSPEALEKIHGMDEGIEYRLKKQVYQANSFSDFIKLVKTKRYTQTRLQRLFVHLLTNTRKDDISQIVNRENISYIRLLGMNAIGQSYINKQKKNLDVPLYTNLHKKNHQDLYLDEKAMDAYYSILSPEKHLSLRKQMFTAPIII